MMLQNSLIDITADFCAMPLFLVRRIKREMERNAEKTRTKVVHKNVSQGCSLIKRLEHNIKLAS